MKLAKFLVQNYRSVENSGEVNVSDYTVLVGKNESGKTTILRALHKFNPAIPEPFNGLREFPRRRFDEFKKQAVSPIVASLTFKFTEEEVRSLSTTHAHYSGADSVKVSKNYLGQFTYEFLPSGDPPPVSSKDAEIAQQLTGLMNACESIKVDGVPEGEQLRQSLKAWSQELRAGLDAVADLQSKDGRQVIDSQSQTLSSMLNSDPKKSAAQPIVESLNNLQNRVRRPSIAEQAREFVQKQLPVFIYFENYANVDSRVHLPSFVQAKQRGGLKPDDKTVSTLLDLVSLDADELVALGSTGNKPPEKIREDVDTRSLLVDRASLGLTGEVANLWGEEGHRVEFDLDGEYMRLWVRDRVDGARVELEQRSKGFQWFLSFYIIFMVESEKGHKNAILLLDEPGLHLHAEKQEELIGVLRTLSQRNQLIYTSHSPFMIDTDALDSIKVVTFDPDKGSTVSDTTWATDKEALFPLQAALGYTISQSLFIGKDDLLVEGITDYWMLSSFSTLFRDHGLTALDPELIITPAGGAQKVSYLTSLMKGQKLRVTILLDSDQEGVRVRDDVVKSKILAERHVIFVDEGLETRREAELEDLFPEDFYLRFVNEAYSVELGKTKIALPAAGNPRIVPRLEQYFASHGITFYKTRPARLIMHELSKLKPNDLPPELTSRLVRLFTLINQRRPQKDT